MRTGSESVNQCPQIQILSHPIDSEKEITPSITYRPEIEITLYNVRYNALLDSGASVSAISEHLYKILKNDPLKLEVPTFPLTCILLTTAIQGKTIRVSSQVYLTFNINDIIFHAIFLVVPLLSTPLILGSDWLQENHVNISYEHKEITLASCNIIIPFNLIPDKNDQKLIHSLHGLNFENDDQNEIVQNTVSVEENIDFNDIPLSIKQQTSMNTLLEKYHHIFQDRPGLHKYFSFKFKVREHSPYKIKPYPIPFSRRPAVQKEINKMLEWGVIERSDSPYNNPLITVIKTDGSIRLCLDARRLNTIIIPTRDTSPPIDDILAKFNNKSIFSSLDFASGYWQIPLDSSVRQYTSFLHDGRSYQFCVVPFGLNVSNAAFSKGLEAALNNSSTPSPLPNDIHTYVDDILISSASFEDHVRTLEWVCEKISLAGLTLKFKKCHFNREKIKFLGHFISAGGVVMDPDKVQALKNFPEPRNRKDLQAFFGFCNFYRKFSQNHSALLHPLSHLLKKETCWFFKNNEKEAFEKIKSTFSDQVALTHPNFNKTFCIQTDASLIGLGAELFQVGDDGQRHTIAFASRSLCGSERNYTITELELLGILFACQKFRIYILGFPINIYTDHKALIFLFSCKLRNARLTRWTLILQEYDLKIFHCPGKDNPLDTLSRHPIGRDDQPPKYSPAILLFDIPPVLPPEIVSIFTNITHEQSKDQRIVSIILQLKSNDKKSWHSFYKLHHNILFINKSKSTASWSIFLPQHLIQKIVVAFHDHYGHIGPLKTAHSLSAVCYFPSFRRTVRSIVQACDICQKSKPKTTRIAGPMQHVISKSPLDKLLVDFYGPLPTGVHRYSYVFVVLDNFTRFVKLYPLCKATAKACVNKLIKDYIPEYGTPKVVVSDHGRQFISHVWQTTLTKLGVQVGHTSVYHPQSNPAERVMRELGRLFRTYCNQRHSDWPKYVTYIEWTLNNVRHESTHYTPSELFLNHQKHNPLGKFVQFPSDPICSNYKDKLILANEVQLSKAEQRKRKHDYKLNPTLFNVHDLVLVRTHKLSNYVDKKISKFFLLYEGPYKVTQIKKHNSYALINPNDGSNRGTFNIIHLKKYVPPVTM